uniref:Integrase catalytic domain-containing protein n=1 Tax=Chenopodium quinoa TaxID=63459 RepID=A0A803MSQ1_CHEQI
MENRKKDAKALFFIQLALDDDIFPRITAATSSHEAWETLKQEYLGDQRVIKVRLQTPRSDFSELAMGEKENVQNYLSRVTEIVCEMRSNGEKISNETTVSKVLRSLNDDWNNVVPAIEESKDLSSFTFDELMGSLLAHESRMNKSVAKVEENAFQVKGESSFKGKSENSGNHGRAHNLLSIGQLMSSGYKIVFDDGVCAVINKKSGHSIANVHMTQNKMFPLDVSNDVMSNVLIAKLTNESELWHLCYGHLNGRSLKLLSHKEMVVGLPKIGELSFCEGCVYRKHSKASFPTGKAWRASECLELVNANLCGPMKTESLGGSRYFMLLTDDYSRMSWVYFLKFKSEAFENFKKFKALVENQSGRHIIALRTDRGGEFVSDQFNAFCDEHGIRRDLTAPYTPEQNGVAERKNRTVVEMARSMLKAKGLPNKFWREAMSTSVYALVNNRSKLDDKPDKCIFIGYCSQFKAYHLYNPVSGKVIISRNVVFNEEARFKWNVDKDGIADYVPVDGEADEQPAANSTTSSPASTPPSTPSSSTSKSPSSFGSSDSRDTPVRRSRSLAKLCSSCNYALLVTDPILFEEAEEQPKWQLAMREEMAAIERNNTWESAIAMSKNPAFHARTQHVDVQHHFVRQLVADGKIILKICGTNEKVADIFTKALPQAKPDFF